MTKTIPSQPRVLVIDDDPMMRLLVRKTLEGSNMLVVDAGSGEQGVQLFREQRPDILLLDVVMPHMDGFAVCHAIRQIPGAGRVPILMLTGLDDAPSIERAYEEGVTDFITKPITWPLLAHRVRYMLRANHAFLDLANSQASLANAQRIAGIGSWDWNVYDNRIDWTEEVFRICGLDSNSVMPTLEAFLNVVHPEDRRRVKQSFSDVLKFGKFTALDHRLLRPDGSERVVHAQGEPAFDEAGNVLRLAGTLQDITERRRAEEQIRYLAFHDSLTGLPNRQWFKEMFNQAQARAVANETRIAVLCMGLDRFKLINDTLGYNVGDKLLEIVGKRLKGCLRSSDPIALNDRGDMVADDVARLSGDEFTVLLNDVVDVEGIAKLATRVLDEMAPAFVLNGQEIALTASIGIAIYPNDGIDFDNLLKNADRAMYYAKEQGSSNFQFYTQSMNAAALERLSLESRLRKALERDEFELHYQPQVDLSNGRISGVEALIRWRDPELGMISPARFIPIAEETGLIMPIGEWVMHTACAQARAWHLAGHVGLSVAVNFSARQFRHQNIPEMVRRVLTNSGLESQCLEVELTESILMHDLKVVVDILRDLKDIGVVLSLDDFGTGYSSLSYLRRFPIDVVKIDQTFVRDLTSSDGDASLTKAIIAMAHSLNMKTIAEGVETQSQLAFLCANQCDAIQGYYFSRPVPANDMFALLRDGKRLQESELARERASSAVLIIDNDEQVIASVKQSLRNGGHRLTDSIPSAGIYERLGVVAAGMVISSPSNEDDIQTNRDSDPDSD